MRKTTELRLIFELCGPDKRGERQAKREGRSFAHADKEHFDFQPTP